MSPGSATAGNLAAPGVVHPTILLGEGPVGLAVLDRFCELVPADAATWRALPADIADEALATLLGELLRVARPGAQGGPRLDLVLVVDRTTPPPGGTAPRTLAATVDAITRLVSRRFSAVFPLHHPPEQRAAALHVVVLTSAMDAQPASRQVLAELAEVEAAASPLLARLWVGARHTPAGILGEDDLIASTSAWLVGLYGSGLRDDELVRGRLSHPAAGDGRACLLTGALLDVPLRRLNRYAVARAAYEALATLRLRVQPRGGHERGLPGWEPEAWIAPFVDGPAAAQWTLACRRGEPNAMDAARRALTDAEVGALGVLDAATRNLLHQRLAAQRPLDQLAETELALAALRRRVAEAMEAELRGDAPPAPAGAPAELVPPAPGRSVVADLRRGRVAVAAASTVLVAALLLAWLAAPPATTAGVSATVITSTAAPAVSSSKAWLAWVVGPAVGALLWHLLGRARAEQPLASPPPPPVTSTVDPRPTLRQARQRVRRATTSAIDHVLERTATLRAALVASSDAVRQVLDAVGARAEGQVHTDLPSVLGPTGRLHEHLVSVPGAAAWLIRCRRWADAEAWTDRVVDGTWPADGLLYDVPAADPAQVLALAGEQAEGLGGPSLFSDEGSAAEAVSRTVDFIRRVAPALQPPVQPRGPHGDPALGIRPGEALLIVPAPLSAAVESGLRRAEAMPLGLLASPPAQPVVAVLRTWEGLTVADLSRGAGVPVGAK